MAIHQWFLILEVLKLYFQTIELTPIRLLKEPKYQNCSLWNICQKYYFIKFGLTPESTIVWSERPWEYCYQNISLTSHNGLNGNSLINPSGTDRTKWSNTPKQLNVFDHFVGLALKGLKLFYSSFTSSSNGSVIVTKNIVVITAITLAELLLVLMCLSESSQTYL